mmetsp:Transcript_72031/g.166848  ORF Transcript_72031/g.166848 Transcript_72031/m.166848 type:complete len:242 (-) Transcript_72031:216-941(-)
MPSKMLSSRINRAPPTECLCISGSHWETVTPCPQPDTVQCRISKCAPRQLCTASASVAVISHSSKQTRVPRLAIQGCECAPGGTGVSCPSDTSKRKLPPQLGSACAVHSSSHAEKLNIHLGSAVCQTDFRRCPPRGWSPSNPRASRPCRPPYSLQFCSRTGDWPQLHLAGHSLLAHCAMTKDERTQTSACKSLPLPEWISRFRSFPPASDVKTSGPPSTSSTFPSPAISNGPCSTRPLGNA